MDLSYLAAFILAVNVLVFLGGCILAVYRTHAARGRLTTPPETNAVRTRRRSGATSRRSIPLRLASRRSATPNRSDE
jgi:hypothetical protein